MDTNTNRRGFLTGLSATAMAVTIPESTLVAETAIQHFFDFSCAHDTPFTTDPKYVGKLCWGAHNHLKLDGKEIAGKDAKIVRFLTGKRGWVERQSINDDGSWPVLSDEGDFKTFIQQGEVEFYCDPLGTPNASH